MKGYNPETIFCCVICDLDLGIINLNQSDDELVQNISKIQNDVKSYGSDMDFCYVRTMTLTLDIWLRIKTMIHSWVMDNNSV